MRVFEWIQDKLGGTAEWDRFTDRLRAVMNRANHEAVEANAQKVTSNHLLAAIIYEGSGVGMQLLRYSGVVHSDLQNQYNASTSVGFEATGKKLSLSRFLKKVINASIDEAIGLGDQHVGTEHIVLAMAKTNDGLLADAIKKADLTFVALRAKLIELRLQNAARISK